VERRDGTGKVHECQLRVVSLRPFLYLTLPLRRPEAHQMRDRKHGHFAVSATVEMALPFDTTAIRERGRR